MFISTGLYDSTGFSGVFTLLMYGWLLLKNQQIYFNFTLSINCNQAKKPPERDKWTWLLSKNNGLHKVASVTKLKSDIVHSCACFTSISQRALELVAEVADCRSVVLRKTCCCFLYSSPVRNFSCSAWNSRTTSPWQRTHIKSWDCCKVDCMPFALKTCSLHGALLMRCTAENRSKSNEATYPL